MSAGTKDNAPGLAGGGGVEEGHCFAGSPDFAKSLANAKARAALLGVVLIESTNDTGQPEFLAAEGVWVRAFTSVVELLAWLAAREGRA